MGRLNKLRSRVWQRIKSLSDLRHSAEPLAGVFLARQLSHGGCACKTKVKNYENKRSEVISPGADDHPGRFPDLFSNGRTQQWRHSQRQLCRTGDVCCNDRHKLTLRAKLPERRIENMSDDPTQDDLDNHANQLNPNNDEYWNSRGQGDDD